MEKLDVLNSDASPTSQSLPTLEQQRRLALSCWYLTGATASGKSEVSLRLAESLGAEIVSLDSMAVYREMDIGTAKPTAEQRQRIPHHLIDLINPDELFSVTQYRERALRAIAEIRGRGREVVFVGGTALYLKALLRGLFRGPPADWEFRRAVAEEAAAAGVEALYRRLQQVDPLAADRLHPRDQRRIIRALEVYTRTGVPISHWQREFDVGTPAEACRVFSLRHPRALLHTRIDERVAWMFAAGLIEEARGLLERWPALSRTALQAVGYLEAIAHVRGETDHATTEERVRIRTRRFARHQETWFRGLSECRILDVPAGVTAADVADQVLRLGRGVDLAPGGD